MPRSSGLLPRLWRAFRTVSGPVIPYAVACPACGFLLHGNRQARHQVAPCPHCQHLVFILPRSPFGVAPAENASAGVNGRRRFWIMPVLAGAAALLILTLLILALLPYLARPTTNPAVRDLHQQIEAGRLALTEGRFHQAVQDLGQSWEQVLQQPSSLTEAEQSTLYQWYRQADLLDRLLSQSLQELLAQAQAARGEEEWQARFRKDYQGKAVVFDDLLRLDGEGRPVLGFTSVRSGEVSARLAVEDVRLLTQLPLGQPQRVIFGARLAGFARGHGGNWIIRFQPDSGVMLTDEDAFRAFAPLLLDRDEGITKVLKQQSEWVEK